jgi:hypothetical protein
MGTARASLALGFVATLAITGVAVTALSSGGGVGGALMLAIIAPGLLIVSFVSGVAGFVLGLLKRSRSAPKRYWVSGLALSGLPLVASGVMLLISASGLLSYP